MKIVRVKWNDSVSMNRWQPANTVDAFAKSGSDSISSVGYLYKKTKKVVILIQSVHGSERNYAETLKIPRECITSIKVLK